MNYNMLSDRFFIKPEVEEAEDSILQQIANNRGSMLDMYAVANGL
jgi:hypothetical protein